MTKLQFNLKDLIIAVFALNAVIISFVIFSSAYSGSYNQMYINSAFSTIQQLKNEKTLQPNLINSEVNHFMIYEFKNIYRVKA